MCREELGKNEGKRDLYTGEFVRFGWKNGYMGVERTILLKNVKDSKGNVVTEHLWFNLTKWFEQIGLQEGDLVEFRGKVEKYVKGYKGWRDDVCKPLEEDYKLSRPTKVRKLPNV